jgi:hypothetical protein
MRAFIPHVALALAALWLTPLSSLATAPDADLPPAIAFLPDANPYRPLLAQLHRLPPDQTEALNTWLRAAERDPTLVPDQPTATLLREVTLTIATTPPSAPDVELWPTYAPPSSAHTPDTLLTPPFKNLRQISQLARLGARQLSPAESTSAYLGLARLGRSLRTDEGTIIHHMIGLVLEDQSRRAAATRLNDFSADSLGQLLDLWNTLPPAREGLAMFDGELVFMESNLRRDLLPGLKALEAELKSPASSPGDSEESPATFTRGLRLSGMADLGRGESWISLENEITGQYLRFREGETVEGFTLVSADFAQRRARLRHADGGEAILDLSAKRVTEIAPLARLKETYALVLGEAEATAFLDKLIRELRAHPDGAEGYLRDIMRNTERAIAHTVAEARKAKFADIQPWPDLEQSDPLTKMAYGAYPKLVRQAVEKATAEQMFLSALQLRRASLGGPPAQPAADPFAESAAPFAYEATEDGGFVLRSAFETRADTPLRYKFGSADSGPK